MYSYIQDSCMVIMNKSLYLEVLLDAFVAAHVTFAVPCKVEPFLKPGWGVFCRRHSLLHSRLICYSFLHQQCRPSPLWFVLQLKFLLSHLDLIHLATPKHFLVPSLQAPVYGLQSDLFLHTAHLHMRYFSLRCYYLLLSQTPCCSPCSRI